MSESNSVSERLIASIGPTVSPPLHIPRTSDSLLSFQVVMKPT